MNKKNTIRLTESQLKGIISESVRNLLNESMETELMMDELNDLKSDYDLDGVEITPEDAERVFELMETEGLDRETAIETVLEEIRDNISPNWDELNDDDDDWDSFNESIVKKTVSKVLNEYADVKKRAKNYR